MTACEYTDAKVQPGDYLLSFDYQSDNAQQAGYYAEFSGSDKGLQEQITIPDRKWHTYNTKIRVPELTANLRLYLHAYESNGTTKNTVRFDNVKLTAVPPTDQQFYVVSEPEKSLQQPKSITFQNLSTTKRTIHVSGARAPFIVDMSETYHPGWRLELDNARIAGINSWRPGVQADTVDTHFQLNNYANGWYVDPAKLCANNKQGCSKQADGSYNITMVAEFAPQRWFIVNRAISIATLVATGGYLLVTHRRHGQDEEGLYRHPLLSSRLARRQRK